MTLLVLLDLSAAFDSVDHAIFLQRISTSFGVNGIALKWFKSYIHGRSQKVNRFTAILGDSLLKRLRHDKIGRSIHCIVSIWDDFCGATTDEMKDYIRPTLRRMPNNIILHVGTNDTSRSNASEIVTGIDGLCK